MPFLGLLTVDKRDQHLSGELRQSVAWKDIVSAVEKVKKAEWKSFENKYGDWGRDMVLLFARNFGGMKLKEMGKQVRVNSESSIHLSIKRLEQRIEKEKEMTNKYNKVLKIINTKL